MKASAWNIKIDKKTRIFSNVADLEWCLFEPIKLNPINDVIIFYLYLGDLVGLLGNNIFYYFVFVFYALGNVSQFID